MQDIVGLDMSSTLRGRAAATARTGVGADEIAGAASAVGLLVSTATCSSSN
jgi:hypothetical protein